MGSCSNALVAAGKGGLVSVFDAQHQPVRQTDTDDVLPQEPAISAKVHARWISRVQLLPPVAVGEAGDTTVCRLLSAADDRSLVLSDVTLAASAADASVPTTVVPSSRLA